MQTAIRGAHGLSCLLVVLLLDSCVATEELADSCLPFALPSRTRVIDSALVVDGLQDQHCYLIADVAPGFVRELVAGAIPGCTEWRSGPPPLESAFGLRFGEGGALSGDLAFGRGRIDAKDAALPDLTEWIAEAELVFRINSRTRLKLEGERLPGFAVYEDSFRNPYTTMGEGVFQKAWDDTPKG